MGDRVRALGLMSGTSLDGIDVATLVTDGENQIERGPCRTYPYDPDERALLTSALSEGARLTARDQRPGVLAAAERMITERHIAAVQSFLAAEALDPAEIAVIGFHGQTMLHRPQQRLTVQIGDAQTLARRTGLPVIADLRGADVLAGGQGAPLVPVYHRAMVAHLKQVPVAVVNIGGVANITWIGPDGTLLAFDTGPGNAPLDDWMRTQAGLPYDAGGRHAAAGVVDEAIAHACLSHPYFAAVPPKSLDRQNFTHKPVAGMSLENGAATLTAIIARTIAKAREHVPREPQVWVICGGGRKNATLMSELAGLVENAVIPAEAAGLDGDSVEAEAWAYLAVRSLRGLPITFPGTTGVALPLTGGRLVQA